ncbi:MAG: tagaturonate epimerase family protein [Spirochaetes bacterium]|nr:tagaturonate epimerase family protein [Spirochaetota bacterium]MBU0956012.1 tagaturonate epimerase family protein [Spirochaetota bacterium]
MSTVNNQLKIQRKRELLFNILERQGLLEASEADFDRRRAAAFGRVDLGEGAFYYPRSFFRAVDTVCFLGGVEGLAAKKLYLASRSKLPGGFTGSSHSLGGWQLMETGLSYENYLAAKDLLPFLAPVSLRGQRTTIGCGDRLGLAGPGHIRAADGYAISPVLAQQSIRELTLTGRIYPEVVKDAAFAVLQEGYASGYGADGDHLKTLADIDIAVDAGMPMITLDLTEVMNPAPADWSDEAVASAFDALSDTVKTRVLSDYSGKTFSLGDESITLSEIEAKRCALMYWKALDFSVEVDARLRSRRGDHYDLEISIDETTAPTIPSHHLFIAAELKRRGVTVNSLAPRFIGEFQKGIDYIGDLAEFERQFVVHCRIAKAYGDYKVSIHSGSDKFSAYPIIGRLTGLRVHVKTAGTSWLESLRAVSLHAPQLFRHVLDKAYRYYPDALKLYHITPDLARIPKAADLSDAELASYLALPESRQLLHVTYGGLLNDPELRPQFFSFLQAGEEAHYACVRDHLRKHIELLGVPRRD